jgi:hypothetical protein
LLAERLRSRFRVFFDLEAIELGAEFMFRIQQELSEADIVLVMIGADWDPARLEDPADVVAYELRLARRFGRRTIPVVVEPAEPLLPGSLPDDLRWLAELNAFLMPEPPGHSAAMVQLVDLLEEETTTTPTSTTTEPPSRTAFAIPHDAEMLERQEGNIRFKAVDAMDGARLCSIASDGSAVWLGSSSAVELRALGDGIPVCRADESGVVWLHRIEGGAIVVTSGLGYHAPDNICFQRFICRDGRLETSECGGGYSWQTPPVALAPNERLLASSLDLPSADKAQVGFVKLDTDEENEYLGHIVATDAEGVETGTLGVSSLTFDATADRLYALGRLSDRWHVASIDVASSSVDWLYDVDADLLERDGGPELHYWRGRESPLLIMGSHVYELDSSSGKPLRVVLELGGPEAVLATDPATSLACAVDEESVLVFSGLSKTVASLAHGATRALACDVSDGRIVVLLGYGDQRRLLVADDVPEALEGPSAAAPASEVGRPGFEPGTDGL